MKNYILLFCFMICAGMLSAQALKVAADGNVGVGIADPEKKLHVSNGSILVKGTVPGDGFIIDSDQTAAGFRLQADGGGTNSDDFFVFQMRNVFGDAIMSVRDISAGTWNEALKFNYLTKRVDLGGDVYATSYNSPSDKRLKKNVSKLELGLGEVVKMNPVVFNYTGDFGLGEEREHIGIIAQDLDKIAPQLVEKREMVKMDESGYKVKEKEQFNVVRDSEVKWLLVNAIKEQQEIIVSMQNQIKELQELMVNIQSTERNAGELSLELSDDSFDNKLGQNSPNPYNDQTVIKYLVSDKANSASISFFNSNGQLIRKTNVPSGEGKLMINSDDLPSGTYSYALEVDGIIISNKKMVIMK